MTTELKFSLNLLGELKRIRNQFTAGSVAKSEKNDGTPVTELDQKLSDHIVRSLEDAFPQDSIVSEELKEAITNSSSRTWFIDPLDGTKEFIKGLDEWSVHLGLVENNEVIFGLVGALDMNKVYYAHKGHGAFVTGLDKHTPRQLQCDGPIASVADLKVVTSRSRSDSRLDEFIARNKITHRTALGSLGLKICAIADGSADVYLNYDGSCSLWDTCAPEVILKEARGHISYIDNSNIDYRERSDFVLKKGFLACSKNALGLVRGLKAL